MSELPRAGAGHDDATRNKINAAVAARNLASASNNTKWDELINHFRELQGWRPSYRSKCVTGYVSEWDVEWFYHLPFTVSICVRRMVRHWLVGSSPLKRTAACTYDH